MAKINRIRINQAIQNLKHISYLSELPTANADSADFVSINNVLYAKQVNNGVYSYAEIGGGGTTVIEKTTTMNDETGLPNLDTLTFTVEEFETMVNEYTILKINVAIGDLTFSYFFKPVGTVPEQVMYSAISQRTQIDMNIDNTDGVISVSSIIRQISNEIFINTGITNGTPLTDIQFDGQVYLVPPTPTVINLNTYVPSTATNGTLDSSVLQTLQASDSNYIVFNNEIFKLADKQHNEGYLVYSHNGHDTTGCFFQKCITITISTRGWVLEEQENASKSYVDNAIGTALQGDY